MEGRNSSRPTELVVAYTEPRCFRGSGMLTRPGFIGTVSLLAVTGCLSDDTDSDTGNGGGGPSLSSPAFVPGTMLPVQYTCDGEDISPPLEIRATPGGVESLAVVVDDPDASTEEPFVHWLIWNIPPALEELPEDVPREPIGSALDGAVQGTNDFGDRGYRGPCPPTGDEPHTNQFRVLLLDTTLDLEVGTDGETFRSTADSHVSGEATITAKYARQ